MHILKLGIVICPLYVLLSYINRFIWAKQHNVPCLLVNCMNLYTCNKCCIHLPVCVCISIFQIRDIFVHPELDWIFI